MMIDAWPAKAGDAAPSAVMPSNIAAMAMPPRRRGPRQKGLVNAPLPLPSDVLVDSSDKTLKNYDSSVHEIICGKRYAYRARGAFLTITLCALHKISLTRAGQPPISGLCCTAASSSSLSAHVRRG